MIKNSIFYYTNNVLPKKILEKTLKDCVKIVEENSDTELIITSHLPLTKSYDDVSGIFSPFLDKRLEEIGVSLEVDIECKRVHSYVVGNLPHVIPSIVSQILFSLENSLGENILMFEHDVFYPDNYFSDVVSELDKGYDFAYYKNAINFCNLGFSQDENSFLLSRFSGKRESWKNLYKHIKESGSTSLEPGLEGIKEIVPRDVIYFNNYSIIEGEVPVLDINHGLNTSGKYINIDSYGVDSYWGNMMNISALFDSNYMNFINQNRIFKYGLHSVS
jgi:hypothetical protein